jgi:hypothetical protein
MKFIFLFSIFLPFSAAAMDKELTIKNKSEQDITVYFTRPEGIRNYKKVSSLTSEHFYLQKPDTIIVHFNKMDRQRTIAVDSMDRKLVVYQYELMDMKKHTLLRDISPSKKIKK